MRPRISIRGSVRRSVRRSVGPSVRRSVTPSLRRLRDASNAEYVLLLGLVIVCLVTYAQERDAATETYAIHFFKEELLIRTKRL